MLAHFCLALVAMVFLGTGAIKALDARAFIRQVGEYGFLPRAWTPRASVAFIAFEWFAGAALLVGLAPVLPPLLALGMLAMAALTVWGTSTGRVEDCGCYGGFLRLRPWQSVVLDFVYVALLGTGWALQGGGFGLPAPAPVWKWLVPLAAAAAAGALGWRTYRKGPLMAFQLIKPGRYWSPGWLGKNGPSLAVGAHFVVFLSRECGYCKRWVPLLNVIHVQEDLPGVLGLLAVGEEERKGFLAEHMIRFPVRLMRKGLMGLMADAYPTAVLVEDGVIRQKWMGEMPPEYVERVRSFFDSISVSSRRNQGFSG